MDSLGDGPSRAGPAGRQSPATLHYNSSSDEDSRAFHTHKLFQILRTRRPEGEIIEKLAACLKAGADINARNGRGRTVLRIAKNKNYDAVTEFLLQQDGIVSEENIPVVRYIDIDEGFTTPPLTEFIVNTDLKLSCPNYIELLNTVTKHSIHDKLSSDPYPSDRLLALFALKAYSENLDDETPQELPEGWELLTTASNAGWLNGYFGVAFWCRALQQVVVAHRGTKLTNTGALWANMWSVVWTKETSHVCSAVTFTAAIASTLNEVKEKGVSFQLSVTGHSLGGWLAQVTAFTVKYLQKDGLTFRKMTNIGNGFHAHTVVFDSPGCRPMLSRMIEKFDLRYKRTFFLKRLDISSYLSAPNRINCLNLHLGRVYRIVTDLSDLSYRDDYTLGYTLKTHGMEKIHKALTQGTPTIHEMLDWPLRGVLRGGDCNKFFKAASRENKFHQQSDRYKFKEINRNSCSLRIFTEDELLFLDAWMVLKKSNMNLTNSIDGLTVANLFDEFVIDDETETITCASEESMKKVIRHTKALMRWLPVEAMTVTRQQAALVPSAAEAMLRAEGDNYLSSVKRSRVDFRDTMELEAFLTSSSNILIIRTSDSDTEMAVLLNIFNQIKRKWENLEKCRMYTREHHYSFADLNGIKRLESAVNIQGLFQSSYTDEYLFIIHCGENYDKNFENIFKELSTNLKNNPDNKLVLVESHDSGFEDFSKSTQMIGNNLVLRQTNEIKLSDLTEAAMKILFEQKIILLQGEKFSLREFVGEYRHLTVDQLNRVNELIGTQMLKNLLNFDNYVVEVKDILLHQNDLRVHSTLNKKVDDMKRVAQALQTQSREALLVISGIGREELRTGEWNHLADSLGEERIYTTAGDGESLFRQMCREIPSSTVYWLAASAEHILCKTIYDKGFYIKRRFHKIIFNIELFVRNIHKDLNIHRTIFVFQNVENKQFLKIRWQKSIDIKNIITGSEHVKMVTSAEEVECIMKENPDRPVHVLKLEVDSGVILWQRSQGSLEDLRPYVTADIDRSIEEEEFCKTSQKVVIIADEPGTGKSTSLTSMSRLLRPDWVIRINLKDHQVPLQKLQTKLSLNSVCEFILRDQDSWLRGLLQFCLDKSNKYSRVVYLLFDGFDEIKRDISPTNNCPEKEVLRLMKYLNNETTARLWITTRLHGKKKLEDELSALAMHFEKIADGQQLAFLVNFWRSHLLLELENYGETEKEQLDRCAEYVYKNAKNLLGKGIKDFMGIPLLMRMLAVTFMERVKIYVELETDIGNIFGIDSVFDLYRRFIRLKYEIYFGDKTGLNERMSSAINNSIGELISEKHRMLGITTLFPEFTKKYFHNHEDGWGAELCRIGLVQSGRSPSEGENIEFIHSTLGEYFCADLIINWLNKSRYHGYAPMMELLLTEILLRDCYEVIQFFINNFVLSQPLSADTDKFIALKICELWRGKQHLLFNEDHQTALHAAVEKGNAGVVDLLVGGLKSEPVPGGLIAFVAAHDSNGNTALGLAARMVAQKAGTTKIMKKMVHSVEACPYEVILQLLLATYIKYTRVDKYEIKRLSDYLEGPAVSAEIKKAFIRTEEIIHEDAPSFLAAVRVHKTEYVDKLYRKMKNDTERHYLLLAPDGELGTVLHLAAQDKGNEEHNKSQTKIIKILCNHNIPEVGRSYNAIGRTPLHIAAEAGHLHVVQHLINHGVHIDSLSLYGETALFFAAGNLPMVKYLVKNGSNVKHLNKNNENVLFHAARNRNSKVLMYFVENGADIKMLNDADENVLFPAVRSGKLSMVQYLVQKGSDVNIVNKDGENVLFDAACRGSFHLVEYLVNNGSDINVVSKDGENVLFPAVHSGKIVTSPILEEEDTQSPASRRLRMVKYLVEKGADINISNNAGETLLEYAFKWENGPVMNFLGMLLLSASGSRRDREASASRVVSRRRRSRCSVARR